MLGNMTRIVCRFKFFQHYNCKLVRGLSCRRFLISGWDFSHVQYKATLGYVQCFSLVTYRALIYAANRHRVTAEVVVIVL